MKLRNVTIFIVVLILLDQLLKIWIKTHMSLGEAIIIFPDWFQLRFIENNGAAFGMQISKSGAFDWGKLLLSLFRVVMIGGLIYYLPKMVKKGAHKWVLIPFAMILAGAVGNLIDSAFYGVIFSESTVGSVAHFGGSYAAPMMGKVVDMFYFPLFQWNNVPRALSFLVDGNNYFFGAIFNLADSYISVGVVLFLLFGQQHFEKKEDDSDQDC
ncbi:MAG: lipoprotein signal peptidase [Rikenellaceae bacterium]